MPELILTWGGAAQGQKTAALRVWSGVSLRAVACCHQGDPYLITLDVGMVKRGEESPDHPSRRVHQPKE